METLYKAIDKLQMKVDKKYRQQVRRKNQYIKLRNDLAMQCHRGKITMAQYEAELQKLVKKYL